MKIEKHRLGLVVANSQIVHDVGIITSPILKILSVQVDKGEVVMWVEVDDDLLPERFSFTAVEGEHNIWQNTYRHHFATIRVGDKTYHYHSKNEYEHGCVTVKEVSVPCTICKSKKCTSSRYSIRRPWCYFLLQRFR